MEIEIQTNDEEYKKKIKTLEAHIQNRGEMAESFGRAIVGSAQKELTDVGVVLNINQDGTLVTIKPGESGGQDLFRFVEDLKKSRAREILREQIRQDAGKL